MNGGRKLCILCSGTWVGRGVTFVFNAVRPAIPFSRVRLLVLDEGVLGGRSVDSGNVVRVRLAGNFVSDVLNVVRELSRCSKVKAVISDCSPYQAVVALAASTIMYDRVTELSIECRSTPHEICFANAALPHALGGREGRVTRLRLLARVSGRCASLMELARGLGLSPETVLRHAYALATAGLVRVKVGDGNPVVCGEVGHEAAAIAEAITAISREASRR